MNEKPQRPDIHVAPPLLFATGFVTGWVVHSFAQPFPLSTNARFSPPLLVGGIVLMLLGLALALWGVAVFRRANTTILPFRASTAMVRDGPYRFTRNPMYVGMTMGYLGAALLINSAWPIVLLPVVLITLVRLVISREEAFLSATFGDDYREYMTQVRRWF